MNAYPLLRQLLFQLEPELAHHLSLHALDGLNRLKLLKYFAPTHTTAPCHVMGLAFPNPVGLAAGLDKNGEHIDALSALGFGFIEVGTVTPRPQPGNPQPRLFRLPRAHALINRMGFNNKGIDYLIEQVKRAKFNGILGINIGKNFDTPIDKAVEDYLICLRKAYAHASYISINISSPNTANLRSLQSSDSLEQLLSRLKAEQTQLANEHGRYVPLAVKIAPDMDEEQVSAVAKVVSQCALDGIIATNTTIAREQVAHLPHGRETGGLSGAPVRDAATRVIRQLRTQLPAPVWRRKSGSRPRRHRCFSRMRATTSTVRKTASPCIWP